jgi:hypothetical protein
MANLLDQCAEGMGQQHRRGVNNPVVAGNESYLRIDGNRAAGLASQRWPRMTGAEFEAMPDSML